MKDARDIVVLSLGAGLALAVIVNAGKVQPVLKTAGDTWIRLIRTVSGTDPRQTLPRG